ncbi:MAG: DUF3515 domain-containing protein [Actinobacteria bacterium]|nr:DUF3515 domain-containing protein [Actinomycetota bacterium]MCO5300255.1 DUF3515 domain-containing protein [Candidatus Nanopelagicales bacterium]MCB9428176.1 DUF3515 domain-containing protein [Actinomycetota bacterium]HPE10897.1 DUF3515 domain-containing protein [Actinomycetota bacterium]HPJ19053.1 DUF3515 domain-containing protein [Actinomycetota bacterium]
MPRRALVLTALLLAGCSSAAIPTSDPPADQISACRALVASLPEDIDGDISAGRSEFAAAWGDPPIVLKCGVAVPEAYEKTSEMVVINEVAWFGEEQPNGYIFTAVGRGPLVEVTVPDTHAPEVNPLVDLADVMKQQTEVTGPAGASG